MLDRFSASFNELPIDALQAAVTQLANASALGERRDEIVDMMTHLAQRCNDLRRDAVRKKDERDLPHAEPDDFRKVDIYPNAWEVSTHKLPKLRKNLIDGEYPSLDVYLDTHFRYVVLLLRQEIDSMSSLLREDFLCPLREKITLFLREFAEGLSKNVCSIIHT